MKFVTIKGKRINLDNVVSYETTESLNHSVDPPIITYYILFTYTGGEQYHPQFSVSFGNSNTISRHERDKAMENLDRLSNAIEL